MKVTDRYQNLMERVAPGAARQADKADKTAANNRASTAKAKAATGNAVEVSVSNRAQELAAGSARLEELRTAIQNGTFKVDSRRIAERIVGLIGDA
jgi:anti-sigma28 factor (negative regulator of flagellin synthesis)